MISMASKPIKTIVKIQATAGQATAAPPIGTALGPVGINIGQFVKEFNEKTQELLQSMGPMVIPAVITVYEDRSFDFILKTPPCSELLKKHANIKKGSSQPNKDKVASVSKEDVRTIAEQKMPDLNTLNIESAMRIVEGTARNMGITVTE
jgi:large subunit ribosomal protein L11